MAWRIEKYVVKGEIHNKVPGMVIGLIWLKGLNKPLELNLKGNCYSDMAGARLIFKNPDPQEGDYSGLDLFQNGVVGDMTASKKVKLPANPETFEEDFANRSKIEFVMGNCLYLEWFSETNGRVLIESPYFQWRVSLPKWRLSTKDEEEQRKKNQQAMMGFMDQLSQAIEPDETEFPEDGEMNEFQWEAYLQKSDARSDMLLELFEKYEDDPNCEDIIAEAMGWEIESVEIQEEHDDDWSEEEIDENSFDEEEYMPNHPLITQMMDLTSRIFYETESRKLLSDESNNPWNQLLWHSQLTVSKLIAALEEVAEGMDPEPGFVVATLKRALHIVHLTIATLEAAAGLEMKGKNWVVEIRKDLFVLRESVLNLMQAYRKQGG